MWRVKSGSVGHGEEERPVSLREVRSDFQMIQSTVPREDTDERGPVSAFCLIVNSGRLIATCQPPLPNGQKLALLAGEAWPGLRSNGLSAFWAVIYGPQTEGR